MDINLLECGHPSDPNNLIRGKCGKMQPLDNLTFERELGLICKWGCKPNEKS